jgi:hypothetical protein
MNGRTFSLVPFPSDGPLLRKDEFEGRAGGHFRKGPPPSPQTPLPTPCLGLGERAWERGQGTLAPGPFSQLKITGNITRRSHQLAILYELRGDLAELMVPAAADQPGRRHGLWEATCFEFFLGVKSEARYWEFNLSPAGHWNVYGFTGYRHGMAEERAFRSLPVRVRRRPDSLLVAVEAAVGLIVTADRPIEVGMAAVIQLADGGLTYWALIHPGLEADFHRRDSFLVEL